MMFFMTLALDMVRSLADPTRLRIVALLRAMELSVGELAQVLGQSQPRVSRHVKILCDAGVARRRKEGSWVFLGPGAAERTARLFNAIDDWNATDGGDHWARADTARLVAVRADRAASAARYFESHALDWDAIRSLHVPEAAVEAAMCAALSGASLGRLADVGTGTGRMLELFAPSSTSATGIDRSSEMLRLARAKLSEIDAGRIALLQGDINSLPLDDESIDTLILHQVLHYLPAPEAAMAELTRVLAPNGRVLIVDFAPHDREELRDAHAHARLGFSDAQINGWFAASGLTLDHAQSLEGGALTVKLWRGTRVAKSFLKAVSS
jgi:ubiquinone/menaquinone biosynthesis C-methylase UbiE/DNA-binding transcriptional ArsR family regulator